MEEKTKEYEERRGRGRGRGRGRPRGRAKAPPRGLRVKKRNMIESDDEDEPPQPTPDENEPPKAKQYDQDCDISSLEAPTFTTLDRGPPAPMLRLTWDHPVNLIGEKVLSPRIHICDSCNKPILIYGRMIPCKHVFCLWCAKSEDRVCARCGERVARVEQTGLGTVFMCNYTINKAVCKRTYLSQRDLQAHIDHRHMKMPGTAGGPKEDMKEERLSHRDPRGEGRDQRGDPRGENRPDPRAMNDPRMGKEPYDPHRDNFPSPQQFSRQASGGTGQYGGPGGNQSGPPHQSPSGHQGGSSHNISHIPVMTTARTTNLITVPIQDPPDHASPFPGHGPPPSSHMPPGTHSFTSPPPASHSQPPHSQSHSQPHSQASQQQYSTSLASLSSGYNSQSNQYNYPPNPTPGPPPPTPPNVPPPPAYTSVAPPPPTTFGGGGRGQYEGQYPAPQWSTPTLQTPPTHTQGHYAPPRSTPPLQTPQTHTSSHYSSQPSPQSSQYYRKSF
ncbi:hypothetical protein Pmani_014813 [Petrolisthes manimaculis]|uniref:E3 ubiquitin-protein ligase Hakai n=1 Tax=Petrolisthes manimaculis TaxID=1843537 RepID=A0AAE1UC89_9EUCA|nr:hypothetical protein Pmani_014813 [Petrolisthes manimaculis]